MRADTWYKVKYSYSKKFPFIKAPARDQRWKIVSVSELPPALPFTDQAGRIYTLHTLLNNEVITVGRMGKMLAEFPGLPWEMRMDLAHAQDLAEMRAKAGKWFSPEHGAQNIEKVAPEGEY
jgi:hypothetical protein